MHEACWSVSLDIIHQEIHDPKGSQRGAHIDIKGVFQEERGTDVHKGAKWTIRLTRY